MEIWKDIEEFSKYKVSNFGNIKSKKTGRILKQQLNEKKYCVISLIDDSKEKRTCRVHRLVAYVFIKNPHNLPQINHKDGNKMNNNVDNLEWCDNSYNQKEAYRIGLKQTKAVIQLDLNDNYINEFYNCTEAAKALNLKASSIYRVCTGKRNKYKNYKWKFKEAKDDISRI